MIIAKGQRGKKKMSDLINRKEAVEAIKNEMLSWLEGDSRDYRKVVDAIMDLPTVEAIPVEWINKYTNEHRTYIHAFSEMVACWYDEKEKREYERASDMRDYCERYEPTYNPEDGSL